MRSITMFGSNNQPDERMRNILANDLLDDFKSCGIMVGSDQMRNKFIDLVNQAVIYRSVKCLNYLLNDNNLKDLVLTESEIKQFVQKAGLDCSVVLILTKNDYSLAARYLLADKIDEPDKLKDIFATFLRFSPIEIVDNILTAFVKENPSNENSIMLLYSQAKNEFLSYAPYASRYVNTADINSLLTSYDLANTSNLVNIAINDKAYSMKRKIKAEELSNSVRNSQIKATERFAEVLGDGPAAGLLQKIAEWNAATKSNTSDKYSFSTLRDKERGDSTLTPMDGRYGFGKDLKKSVVRNSTSSDLEVNDMGYFLYYKENGNNTVVNFVMNTFETRQKSFLNGAWGHGSANLKDTWPAIERVFSELAEMRLAEIKDKDSQNYKNKLTAFYDKAAELVWLIGNTTPLLRGSGTYAEFMLAIVHHLNGLNPPILKTCFPQLDVLDITFPLADYKKLFPGFFEPSTIPRHLRFTDLIPLQPMTEQIERMYNKINNKTYHYIDTHHSLLFSHKPEFNKEETDLVNYLKNNLTAFPELAKFNNEDYKFTYNPIKENKIIEVTIAPAFVNVNVNEKDHIVNLTYDDIMHVRRNKFTT